MRRFLALIVCASVTWVGCGDEHTRTIDTQDSRQMTTEGEMPTAQGDVPENAINDGDITYHSHILGLIRDRCAACHRLDGPAPFVLTDYESLRNMGPVSLASIEAGRMPPWQANPDCRDFQHSRVMSSDDKAMFRTWVETGMPEGDPALSDGESRTPTGLIPMEPERIERYAVPYLPSADHPDDYRCLPLDIEFSEDMFIKGTHILPDQTSIVHHVLVYVIPPAYAQEMLDHDAESETPGYACFGGPLFGDSVGPIAGWAPGGLPQFSPDGAARVIPKGSRLVMQMHYNVLAADPVPDQTGVGFNFYDGPQPMAIETRPMPHLGLEIPAGDPNSVHERFFTVRGTEPITIVSTAPHMHTLGTRIRVDLLRATGEEECIIEINDWDFNWQQTYTFHEEDEVVAQPGDTFKLTCEYDNSEMNQQVVNGERLAPQRVTWGDGTLDEMCLNYITVKTPYMGEKAQCAGVASCRTDCDTPDSLECLNHCMGDDSECSGCVFRHMLGPEGCGRASCLPEFALIQGCFFGCIVEAFSVGNLNQCLQAMCPSDFEALSQCLSPQIESGACDNSLNACTQRTP